MKDAFILHPSSFILFMSSPSTQQHHEIAAKQGVISVAIITVSDTRTRENDTGGDLIAERIATGGHRVALALALPRVTQPMMHCRVSLKK